MLVETKTGRKAIWFGAAALACGVSLPVIYWLSLGFNLSFTPIIPVAILAVLIVFLIISLVFASIAIFRRKDRGIMLIIIFALLCQLAAFWIFMIVGEFAVPH